jgi:hypothetical protein
MSFSYPAVSDVGVACVANVTDPLRGTFHLSVDFPAPDRKYVTFFPDGTYLFGIHSDDPTCSANNGNGIEYGVYRWSQSTHAFAIVTAAIDTNGDCGLADGTFAPVGTLVKGLDGTLRSDTLGSDGITHVHATWTPVRTMSGTLIGSWGGTGGFVILDEHTIFHVSPRRSPGLEDGCYGVSETMGILSFTADLSGTCAVSSNGQTAVDTTGPDAGFSAVFGPIRFKVTGDTLEAAFSGGRGTVPLGSMTPRIW